MISYIGAVARVPFSSKVIADCTVHGKYDSEPFRNYVQEGASLLVPRGYALRNFPLAPDVVDARTEGSFKFAINCKVPPRMQEQADVIEKSFQLLKSGQDHLIKAPTGFGKTYVGAAVAVKLGLPTLFVATKSDLIDSWRRTLLDLVGVSPSEIGHIQQNTCDYIGKKFVTAMIHSITIKDRYPPEMFRHFGLVVFDECHRLAADSFSSACSLFPAKYRLGLSATTKRKDFKSPVFEAHIGPVKVEGTWIPMKPKILIKKGDWSLPKVNVKLATGEYIQKTIPFTPGRMGHITKIMIRDVKRNMEFVNFIGQAYNAGRTILCVSDQLDHLQIMISLLGGVVPPTEIGVYIGGKSHVELKSAASKRVVFATYGMVKEGTDYPQWDTLCCLTPLSDVEQVLGRVLRFKEGKKQPVMFDLVDNCSVFRNYHQKRQVTYYKLKADLVEFS